MALTPLEIENYRLRSAFRGYSREDVERLLVQVVAGIEDYVDQIGQLSARVGQLEGELTRYRQSEELLTQSMLLAEKTRGELVAAAEQHAASIRSEAQAEAERIRLGNADLASQREQFEYAFHGLLNGFLQRLEAGNPRLTARRDEREPMLPQQFHDVAGREVADQSPIQASATPAAQDVQPLTVQQRPAPQVAPQPAAPVQAPRPPRRPVAGGVDRDADILGFEAALSSAATAGATRSTPAVEQATSSEVLHTLEPTYQDIEEPHFVIHTAQGDVLPELETVDDDESEDLEDEEEYTEVEEAEEDEEYVEGEDDVEYVDEEDLDDDGDEDEGEGDDESEDEEDGEEDYDEESEDDELDDASTGA